MKLIKRILIGFALFCLLLIGLQIFTDRDFSQVSLAYDKYQSNNSVGQLITDLGIIFKGEKVRQGDKVLSKHADKVMYRWVDSSGQVHVSDMQPNVAEFETLRLGDIEFQTVKGLSEEEIKKVLKK